MKTDNYEPMLKRIDKAQTMEQLNKLERSLDRLWDAGFFTLREFVKLDDILIKKRDSLGE